MFLGHVDDYRETRKALLDRFGGTNDAFVAERIGRACLLLSGSDDELSKTTTLIDRALDHDRQKPSWVYPYFLFAKGLAEYRQGRFGESNSIMVGPASRSLVPAPRLVLAMVRHRLGEKNEALENFGSFILDLDWRVSRAVYDGSAAATGVGLRQLLGEIARGRPQ